MLCIGNGHENLPVSLNNCRNQIYYADYYLKYLKKILGLLHGNVVKHDLLYRLTNRIS